MKKKQFAVLLWVSLTALATSAYAASDVDGEFVQNETQAISNTVVKPTVVATHATVKAVKKGYQYVKEDYLAAAEKNQHKPGFVRNMQVAGKGTLYLAEDGLGAAKIGTVKLAKATPGALKKTGKGLKKAGEVSVIYLDDTFVGAAQHAKESSHAKNRAVRDLQIVGKTAGFSLLRLTNDGLRGLGFLGKKLFFHPYRHAKLERALKKDAKNRAKNEDEKSEQLILGANIEAPQLSKDVAVANGSYDAVKLIADSTQSSSAEALAAPIATASSAQ
jgi:hypothetical protein